MSSGPRNLSAFEGGEARRVAVMPRTVEIISRKEVIKSFQDPSSTVSGLDADADADVDARS